MVVRDQTVVVASVVKAAGGDVNDLTLLTTSTWRKNLSAQTEEHAAIKANMVQPE